MECPVCNIKMFKVGFQRPMHGKIIADYECPSCHQRIQSESE